LFSNLIPWDVLQGLVYATRTVKGVSVRDKGTHLTR